MGLLAKIKAFFTRAGRPVVLGLALGSGGAKGMAHLGALKAFEEEGLVFSVVTGTSIGSIVGALLAKGYSWADMTGIVDSINKKEFSKNLRPFADMSPFESFLEGYLEGDISALPLPFAACATDGATNACVVLREGKIARALTASAAIPPFFRGVDWNGRKLYDGAFSNAIPADVCRELGAQVVVGIDLSAFARAEEEKGRLERLLGSAIGAFTPVRTLPDAKTRGYEAADVMLRPDLYDFKATNISRTAMDAMFEIGYREAKERMPEIRAAIAAARKSRRGKKKPGARSDKQVKDKSGSFGAVNGSSDVRKEEPKETDTNKTRAKKGKKPKNEPEGTSE